jgi:hypothetical protein
MIFRAHGVEAYRSIFHSDPQARTLYKTGNQVAGTVRYELVQAYAYHKVPYGTIPWHYGRAEQLRITQLMCNSYC